MEAVERDLKGADFGRRLMWDAGDGIAARPFHRAEDLPEEAWVREAAPGAAPHLRGYQAAARPWAVREAVRTGNAAEANAAARQALARGADQILFRIYPGGVRLDGASTMKALLAGIDLEATPVFFAAGPLAPQALALLLNEAAERGVPAARLRGGVDGDPILDACLGWREGGFDRWQKEAMPLVAYDASALPLMRTLAIRAVEFHRAGATAAQELAFGLAVFVEYLSHLRGRGLSAERVAGQCEMQLGVGANYLVEIAKLRAARALVAKVLEAFGVQRARPNFHAETSPVTKTVYDPHVNLLRTTTEAMAAAIANVDSLTVCAFDELVRPPNDFSSRMARNVSLLLREEAHVARAADPLGGSYTIERLTADVALKAWELFQEVEANGGFVSAWKAGLVPAAIAEARSARLKAARGRRSSIIGTNAYPNLSETAPPDLPAAEARPRVALSAFAVGDSFTGLREALAEGSELNNWITDTPAPSTPLDRFRPAEPFERLRLRMERHVRQGGARPTVQLVLAGDAKMRKARATFCIGLFGCAGFEVAECGPFQDVSGADPTGDIVVLCSSDAEYPALAAALKPRLGDRTLVIAGYPEAALPELEAIGVRDFVYLRQDAVSTLAGFMDRLGVEA
jgi:methylmalonyl-CoA mutase